MAIISGVNEILARYWLISPEYLIFRELGQFSDSLDKHGKSATVGDADGRECFASNPVRPPEVP
jgi:hypothetical protein